MNTIRAGLRRLILDPLTSATALLLFALDCCTKFEVE